MNIIEKIKKLVMSAESFDFAVYDLAGGGKIECDTETLEIGSVVSLVAEDDSKELAPPGSHTLEDGRTIVLDDSSKVTEIKEADAPETAEVEARKYGKKSGKMSLEVDPELVSSVVDIIKEKLAEVNEEDANSLANEIVYVITVQDEEMQEEEEEEEDSETELEDMKVKMKELTEVVFQMAKNQHKFSTSVEKKLSKVPTGKAISEMEFKSEPEVIDPLAARIEALKNLNK
jgi:hypothetical protein